MATTPYSPWNTGTAGKSYGAYPSTPNPLSGAVLADQQNRYASAAAAVKEAAAQKLSGEQMNASWQRTQNYEIGKSLADRYSAVLASAGAAGLGRSPMVQGQVQVDTTQGEQDDRARAAQAVTDKNTALAQVLEAARRQQLLVEDAINRENALYGSDVAQLIRGA